MQIGWIQLQDFRNYHTLTYSPAPRLNIVAGPNAQGKTNLLEALGLLLTGRSFRTSRLAEIPRWGAGVMVVGGELRRVEGARTIRRTVTRLEDGTWRAEGESCPWARVIAFGWQDLAIVNGAPGARRNFIDGFAGRLYQGHLGTLIRFRQVLARRNRVLATTRWSEAEERLSPWDEQLASLGMQVLDRRRRATAALQVELARVYGSLSGRGDKVEVRYQSALGETTEPAAFVTALEQRRRDELQRGQTLVGPHRDDLAIEIDGVDVRTFASRGQQRLLALALRLAELLPVTEAVGTPPVLLLDDALSELDPGIRANVLREIETGEQVFLTTADPPMRCGGTHWRVNEGGVIAA